MSKIIEMTSMYEEVQNFIESYDTWKQFIDEVDADDSPVLVCIEGSVYLDSRFCIEEKNAK